MPTEPLETTMESSTRFKEATSETRPTGTIPIAIVGGRDSNRPFTLKNLEAPRNFSGIKHPAATTWLTKMSCRIRLSKIPESDLWDVVATQMFGGALT